MNPTATPPSRPDGQPADPIELESFYRARRFLGSILDLDELLRALLEEGLEAVRGTRGFVGLLNRPRGELELRITAGRGWDTLPIRTLPIREAPGSGITVQVVRTGEPYLTGDVRRDPHYRMFFPDVRSELAVPLVNRDGWTLGVLNIESEVVDAFSHRDLQLLISLANQAAIAISVARLRAREAALLEFGNHLASTADPDDLLQRATQAAAEILRADECSLFQVDETGENLILRAAGPDGHDWVGRVTYRVGEGLTGWVAEHGATLRVPNVREDPRWRGLYPALQEDTVEAFLATPISPQGTLWGVLRAVRRQPRPEDAHALMPQEFTVRDVLIAETLARQVAASLTRQLLMEQQLRMERLAAWGELSARAAHMIGNKVFALKGQLNELEHLTRAPHLEAREVLDVVARARRSTGQLEEILNEFRDFMTATRLDRTATDLNELVRAVVTETIPRADAPAVQLELDPDLPPVQVDAAKLRRALSELLENAVIHQGPRGTLTLRTGLWGAADAARWPALVVAARRITGRPPADAAPPLPEDPAGAEPVPPPAVRIEVQDEGPGIRDTARSRLFDPFYTTRSRGMGLGLSIVKGIVEAHDGAITEVGRPGEGAHFVILIPGG